MNRRKGTFQSENQLPEKISGSYFPSENSLQKADEFSLIQFSPQKRKNKMMHNTLDREGGSRKYILLVLGTFCTQCTKFKIVPYDILRCAHRTRCCECAHTFFRLIRNVNCIFRREHGTWNTWIYFSYRIEIDCKKRHLVYKTVVMKWIKVEHYLYKTYKVCVPTIFYSYFSSICIFPSFLFPMEKERIPRCSKRKTESDVFVT